MENLQVLDRKLQMFSISNNVTLHAAKLVHFVKLQSSANH